METVLTAFIILILILFAGMTLFQGYMEAQDTLRAAWQEMEDRLSAQAHTDLTPISAVTKSAGAVVEIVLRNDGDTRLVEFEAWDVIVQYYTASSSYNVAWLDYVAGSPGTAEWSVLGIYMDAAAAQPEVFEPGILNGGEELVLQLRLVPPVGPNSVNLATVATDNGTVTSTTFTR